MPPVDVKQLDITKTNLAVQELIKVTQNPRHRYLLHAYDRQRAAELLEPQIKPRPPFEDTMLPAEAST